MAGIIAGPIITGYVFDRTESYSGAFLGFAGAALVAIVLVLMEKPAVRSRGTGR
jgi:cyanate permease